MHFRNVVSFENSSSCRSVWAIDNNYVLVLVEFGHKLSLGETGILFTVPMSKSTIYWMKICLPIDASRSLPLQYVIVLSQFYYFNYYYFFKWDRLNEIKFK